MSLLAVQGGATGTGTVTLLAPVTNTDRTITLPDATGTVQVSGAAISGTTGTFSGDLSFNSGYGSAAVAYGCRAWVNFNGIGTVAIRGSGNVSSVTDLGVGNYRVNFTTAMPDVNYAVTNALTSYDLSTDYRFPVFVTATATGSVTTQCNLLDSNGANTTDSTLVMLAVFR